MYSSYPRAEVGLHMGYMRSSCISVTNHLCQIYTEWVGKSCSLQIWKVLTIRTIKSFWPEDIDYTRA